MDQPQAHAPKNASSGWNGVLNTSGSVGEPGKNGRDGQIIIKVGNRQFQSTGSYTFDSQLIEK